MYNIAIIDDNPEFLACLANKVKSYHSDFIINTYNDPTVLSSTDNIDVLFIDYELQKSTAFDFLEQIPNHNFLTIIVSSHESVVYRTFKYKIFWFIRKNKLDEELDEVIPLLYKELKQRHQILKLSSYNKNIVIPIKEINYIEKSNNDLLIHADQLYTIRYTYSKLINKFDFSDFIIPIYGVIVNPNYIKYVDFSKNIVKLNNDVTFNISRKYKNEANKKYQEYISKL